MYTSTLQFLPPSLFYHNVLNSTAKAVGLKVNSTHQDRNTKKIYLILDSGKAWQPLEDTRYNNSLLQAMQIAFDLKLEVHVFDNPPKDSKETKRVTVKHTFKDNNDKEYVITAHESIEDNPEESLKRAVVFVACTYGVYLEDMEKGKNFQQNKRTIEYVFNDKTTTTTLRELKRKEK
jgi:hypothetical protein